MKRGFATLLAMSLLLAACGGESAEGNGEDGGDEPTATQPADDGAGSDDGGPDPTSAPETTTTTAPAGNTGGGDTPGVTEMGSFSVNDTEFAVTYLNRCIPFGGEDGETIDLQPLAQGQGAQMNLYGTADSLEVSVQGSTVEDMFGSIAFSADPFGDGEIQESVIDGDRWSGSATLLDSLGSGESVELTWDVMIPDEVIDCSL
ncbi:MAG: hypothetical protein HKN95_07515 [Acidimicrobiia bacterium]|nr:hypothetical protein [Acidimicrobiia bacterium]